MTDFLKRPHEVRVVIANNNSEASADTYNEMTRVRKGDGKTVEETIITGTLYDERKIEPEAP